MEYKCNNNNKDVMLWFTYYSFIEITKNNIIFRSFEEENGDFAFNFSVALQESLYPDSYIKLKVRKSSTLVKWENL